jgi:hypothetical protein
MLGSEVEKLLVEAIRLEDNIIHEQEVGSLHRAAGTKIVIVHCV